MPNETEIKIALDAPDPLRATLRDAGARFIDIVLETNRILDTPDRRLLSNKTALRVRLARRTDGDGPDRCTLTYKGPRDAEVIRTREEIEIDVSDPEATLALLLKLGFELRVLYEKRRETWLFEDCEVVIDELPRLGWFAEIEGPDRQAVAVACDRLGLSGCPVQKSSYVKLAQKHGRTSSKGVAQLMF